MMRSTVRSVGGAPGSGSRCWKSAMTVAFPQTGSERSPSIVGASLVLMRAARANGRLTVVCSPSRSGGCSAPCAAKLLTLAAENKPASTAAFKTATIRLRCTRAAPLRKRSHRHEKDRAKRVRMGQLWPFPAAADIRARVSKIRLVRHRGAVVDAERIEIVLGADVFRQGPVH